MRILSLDPGTTSGYCVYTEDKKFKAGELGPDEHHRSLWDLLCDEGPDLVICEEFTHRPVFEKDGKVQVRRNVILDSKEYIGVVKLWCQMFDAELVMQYASQAKDFWDNDKLKRANLYIKGSTHKRDAMRHMLYYLTFTKYDNTYVRRLK